VCFILILVVSSRLSAKDRRINNCRDFKVAITLRVMIANKNWTVIDSPI